MTDEKKNAEETDEKKKTTRNREVATAIEMCDCDRNCPARSKSFPIFIDDVLGRIQVMIGTEEITRDVVKNNILAYLKDVYADIQTWRNRGNHKSGLLSPIMQSTFLLPIERMIEFLVDHDVKAEGPIPFKDIKTIAGR